MPVKRSRAPDGGYGWVIVLASFLLQTLSIGVTYTFGIMYVDLLEYFQSSQSDTAWIGSIQPALLYFTCVVAGPLMIKFGWRAVTMAGTLISAAGFFISYVAPNIYVLFVTYGFMTGIGYGLMYMVSMIIVQHYFDERRSLATGLAVSGSGMGTVIFGILIGQTTEIYGWRVTTLIEGGISLGVGILCFILIKPIPETPAEDTEIDSDEEDSPLIREDGTSPGRDSSYGTTDTSSTPDPHFESGRQSETTSLSETPIKRASASPKQSSPGTRVSLPVIEDEEEGSSDGKCCSCGDCNLCKTIDNEFHFSLCKSPILIVYCFSVVCFCFGYHVPYTFTMDRAIQMFNIESTRASLLVSIMGISNVSSRLVFGWVGDNSATLRHIMLAGVIILCGVLNCLIFFFNTYTLLIVYSIIFGALSGCFASMVPCVLVDQMGLDNIEYTLGQVLASSSIPFLLASPLSGWIIEKTGSYDIPFLVVGLAQVVGGLAFCTLPLIRRRWYATTRPVVAYDEFAIRRKRRRSRRFSESIA